MLGMSEKSVRNRVSNIFSKLQVVDRGQVIMRARGAGLGRPPVPPHVIIIVRRMLRAGKWVPGG